MSPLAIHLRRLSALLVISLVGLLGACAKPQQRTGTAHVFVETGSAELTVSAVQITITAADITTPITATLTQTGEQWTGVIPNIPAGLARTFTAEATDTAGDDLYDGAATVDVGAGATVLVSIIAQQHTPGAPFQNSSPVITAVTVQESPVAPDTKDQVAVTATDADSSDEAALVYQWTATQGVFDDPTAATTNWNSPSVDGTYSLTVTVTDPHGAFAAVSFEVVVQSGTGTGGLQVTTTFNTWPSVDGVTVTPTQVDIGSTATLAATASDADGDNLTYQWSIAAASAGLGCAGTFGTPASAQTTFVPSATTTAPYNLCELQVHVDDGRGGSNDGFIGIYIQPPTQPVYLPHIDGYTETPSVALGGEPIALEVSAHDVAPTAISFTWTSASGGQFSTQTDVANQSSSITWYPPCATAASGGPVTATVTVTSSAGSVTHDFAATTTCATSCGQLLAAGDPSGPYPLDPGAGGVPFDVYCDNDSNGGGWALVAKLGGTADASLRDDFSADSLSGGDPSVFTAGSLADNVIPAATQDDHYSLARFAAYGPNYTVRTRVSLAADGSGSSGYHYSFWTPASDASCDPSCAGTNWASSGAQSQLLLLQYSTAPGAPPFQSTPSWVVPYAGFDGPYSSWLFAYRNAALENGTSQCVDSTGQTSPCHAPSGGYVNNPGLTGTYSSAYGDSDGVMHAWSRTATYWIANSNSYAAAQ